MTKSIAKSASPIFMVPMDEVFTLSEDTVLDRETLVNISRSGHSRIPVFRDRPEALIGILLVKALITEELHGDSPPRIGDLKLHALPTRNSDTSLFSMLDFFQEGKSHLVLLTNELEIVEGIITLEDVVEELIKEEIYDEVRGGAREGARPGRARGGGVGLPNAAADRTD